MALINIGGRMPDGVKVHEFWVEEENFILASGVALKTTGKSKRLMGKLCLLNNALVMLPYEGVWLKAGEILIGKLQGIILGDYAEMAGWMERLGLIDLKGNYHKLDKVLLWPLALIILVTLICWRSVGNVPFVLSKNIETSPSFAGFFDLPPL